MKTGLIISFFVSYFIFSIYCFISLLILIATGCASNTVVYKKDCRMEPVTKRCIEIPVNPRREGEGRL